MKTFGIVFLLIMSTLQVMHRFPQPAGGFWVDSDAHLFADLLLAILATLVILCCAVLEKNQKDGKK